MSNFKYVIGLTGKARSGKDTAGEILGRDGFVRVSFADAVREDALILNPTIAVPFWFMASKDGLAMYRREFLGQYPIPLSVLVEKIGWEEAKELPEVRKLLQKLGTDIGRAKDPDVWVKMAEKKMSGLDRVVFTDVRFDNEAQLVRKYGGIVIKLTRENSGTAGNHVSESGISQSLVTEEIDNSGTLDELETKLKETYAKFFGLRD